MVAGEDGHHRQSRRSCSSTCARPRAASRRSTRATCGPIRSKLIAKRLGVTEQDVIDMNRRLGGDLRSTRRSARTADSGEWMDHSWSTMKRQESRLWPESEQSVENRHKALGDALTVLNDPRTAHLRSPPSWPSDPITLEELADEFGVSREQVRQIESPRAISRKVREDGTAIGLPPWRMPQEVKSSTKMSGSRDCASTRIFYRPAAGRVPRATPFRL